jgi:hypothetical protein
MDAKQFLVLGASMLAASLSGPAAAQEAREPYVRGRKSRSIRHRSSPNVDAYKSHLETAHFKKYKTTTQDMVKSLKLRDTVPISLGAKAK